MKKSKLLSVLTAGALIATTVGTYAVWDTTTATTDAKSVTFRNPVTVTVETPLTEVTKDITALNGIPTATGTVKFAINNQDQVTATKLTLKPVIEAGDGITTDDFTFTVYDGANKEATTISGDAKKGYADTTLNSTEYTIEVKPNPQGDDDEAKIAKETKIKNAKDITLQLTATLSE